MAIVSHAGAFVNAEEGRLYQPQNLYTRTRFFCAGPGVDMNKAGSVSLYNTENTPVIS